MQTTENRGIHHYTRDVHLPSPTQEPATKPVIHSSLRVTDDHEAEGNRTENPDPDHPSPLGQAQ
jgi:hypothetical protein